MTLYYPTSTNCVQKTLDAQLLAGTTSAVTLNNVVGIQNKAGVFVIDRVDANGTATPAKREYISFTGVSGSTLIGLTRNADGGGSDQDHAVGAIVEFVSDVLQIEGVINTVQDALTDVAGFQAQLDAFPSLFPTAFMARQAIINGNFDVWQRGTSVTPYIGPGYPVADRWRLGGTPDGGTDPTFTFSRQSITPGAISNAFYNFRWAFNGAGSGFGADALREIVQRIENGTRYLCGDGKKVTVSFWAKSDIANKRLGIYLSQNYGSGGSPTATEIINGTNFTLTSSWQKFTHTFTTNTLDSKTFGTNNDDMLILSFSPCWGTTTDDYVGATTAETYGGSGFIDIAQVQLCAGDVALPFMPKSYDEELRDCQRYRQDRVIRTINGVMYYSFPVTMRTTPTTLTASVGTLANGTKDGFQITHTLNVDSTIVADAEL